MFISKKIHSLIIFFALTVYTGLKLIGQPLFFHDLSVDSIIIESSVSKFLYDVDETTKVECNILEVTYSSLDQQYNISNYRKKLSYKTQSNFEESFSVPQRDKKFEKTNYRSFIEEFLQAIRENEKPTSFVNSIDSSQFVFCVRKKVILNLLKQKGVYNYYKKQFKTKSAREEFFSRAASLTMFEEYFSNRFQENKFVYVADYQEEIKIKIVSGNNTVFFTAKYPNPVKQPWYFCSNGCEAESIEVIDLYINRFLENILPDDFLVKDSFTRKAIVRDYVTWYLFKNELILEL